MERGNKERGGSMEGGNKERGGSMKRGNEEGAWRGGIRERREHGGGE